MSYHNISPSVNTESGSQSAIVSYIYIDDSDLVAASSSRTLRIEGDSNAVFSLTATRTSDGKFYDFTTDIFESLVTSRSRLRNQSPGSFKIKFPASSGDTYKIIVTAEPHYNTKLGSIYRSDVRHSIDIKQVGNAVVTFTTAGEGFEGQSQTLSTIGSKATSYSNAYSTINISDMVPLVPSVAGDAGYFITTPNSSKDINNGAFDSGVLYFATGNYVANGAGTNATALILNSVDGLHVGMQVSAISGVYQSALRAITAINTTTKTLTLDGNETWSNDHVILFRAYGPRLINKAISVGVSLSEGTVKLKELTTVIRGQVTSDIAEGSDIPVSGTRGIARGSVMRMRGIDKKSDGVCVIGVVSQSVDAGSFVIANGEITADADTPIEAGSIIYIEGSSNKISISAIIKVSKYPVANQTINIDMEKILTKGSASVDNNPI